MTAEASGTGEGRIVTFYSYKGGTGRTMTLANVAWILAASGKRVLMIDWDLEAPGLHRFFHPFLDPDQLETVSGINNMIDGYCFAAKRAAREGTADEAWRAPYAQVARNAIPVNWRFPGHGILDFVSAARQGQTFSTGFTPLDWDTFYNSLDGSRLLDEMREHLKATYDYVLIDSRTGLSDIETICTKHLPDDLVICFTLSEQNIQGAADMAAYVSELTATNSRRQKIRMLPVVTRIEEAESERLEVGLAVAKARFAPFVRDLEEGEPDGYWNAARIPYKPLYAYEELLAVFGDAPGNQASMLAACERLTGLITGGEVTRLPPINEAHRLQHKESFTRARPVAPTDIYISALSGDQSWVAWLGWLLRGLGYGVVAEEPGASAGKPAHAEVTRLMRAADRTIAVVSAAYQASSLGRAVWEAHTELDPARSGRLIPLQVDETPLGSLFRQSHPVDVAGRDEPDTVAALLRALGASPNAEQALAKAAAAGGGRVRYPRATPAVWSVPNRMVNFTGRDEALEQLRRQLGSGASLAAVLPQGIYGLGGVGKSALALEYAYRNQHDYDVVWWVRAEQPNIANEDLAQLGKALGLPTENMAAPADATRAALKAGKPYGRWLLIFDNADDPKAVSPLLPDTQTGHVLVTSRNPAWTTRAEALEVDPFQRAESVTHLTRRVKGLPEREADVVAEAVGDLPLAVDMAAAWLAESGMEVADYVERLRTEGSPLLTEAPVVATWRVAIERIRRVQPAAVRLLQLFSFFGPEPIALDLVYGDAMIEALQPLDPKLRNNKMMIGRYVQDLGRYSLVKVFRGDLSGVQVHRLIQQVVRQDITDEAEREQLRAQVHTVLAAARPPQGDVDSPELWAQYAKIWPHLGPSQAVMGNGEVRQLYVDRARYLRTRGELRAALVLAQETLDKWTAEPSIGAEDARTLSMQFELACSQRALGNVEKSLEIDLDTLRRQLAHPEIGPDDIATLMTAGGLGGDYREIGRFQDAFELDLRTYQSFVDLFGTDHPRTLAAENNLAVSLRFVGLPFQALEHDRTAYEERLKVLPPRHPFTFSSALNYARDLRDCGDRSNYLELLERSYAECRLALGDDNPLTQQTGQAYAIGLRKAHRLDEAVKCLEQLGVSLKPTGQSVVRAGHQLVVASVHAAQGDLRDALDLALTLLDEYKAMVPPGHPNLLVCVNNVATYHRLLGESEQAEAAGREAFEGMTAALGDSHLMTLASAINLANVWADQGRAQEAVAVYRRTLERLHDVLDVPENTIGPDHPDRLACQANLAVTLHELGGGEDEVEKERARTLAALIAARGHTHPNTVALNEWRRIDRELDPLRL